MNKILKKCIVLWKKTQQESEGTYNTSLYMFYIMMYGNISHIYM